LARLTREAGVAADLLQAAVGRFGLLPGALRHRLAHDLHKAVRRAVADEGARRAADVDCIVAYEGFALPAFLSGSVGAGTRKVLSYPVAHHRHRHRVRDEELEREPAFAATWPGFDDWGPGHEERLDEEIRLADGILVGSQYVADTFEREGIARAKIAVVPYGVDLSTFTPAGARTPGERFRVIYAGQLTQRKGLSYLLRGYRRFRRHDSDLTLVGMPIGGVEALQPYADLFHHVPHQTRPALAQRYRESDVFVLPTLIEGMPLVVVEAMACGLPVIVTANGPAGIVRDGVDGFIVPERDDEAICERLDRLYRDPELRLQMGRNAAERARQFSWQAYAAGARRYLDELSARA
jgi:glycosyltransferase involved in cell wall biosynthesis